VNDDCEIPAEHDDNPDLDLQMPSQQSKLLGAEAQKAPLRLLLIALLNMLSIRTDDRRLSIAYPLMKANRRNFETQRRADVRNALQQNIKVQ